MLDESHKFKVGDKVVINHDRYNAYPKGTKAVVTFVGISRNKIRTYHVKINNEEIVVLEYEIDRDNSGEVQPPMQYEMSPVKTNLQDWVEQSWKKVLESEQELIGFLARLKTHKEKGEHQYMLGVLDYFTQEAIEFRDKANKYFNYRQTLSMVEFEEKEQERKRKIEELQPKLKALAKKVLAFQGVSYQWLGVYVITLSDDKVDVNIMHGMDSPDGKAPKDLKVYRVVFRMDQVNSGNL